MKPRHGLHRSKVVLGMMLALSSTIAFAVPAPATIVQPVHIYAGLFGGVAAPENYRVSQYATAFYTEAAGGPLAVNSFGSATASNTGIFGGKLGMQWAPVVMMPNRPEWGLAPAVEIEGAMFSKNTFTSRTSNNTARLEEHTFNLSLPTQTNVFLANVVLNLESARLGRFSPYVGVGVGGAFTQITNADALQLAPPEAGVNHFNSNPDGKVGSVAGQVKVGLDVVICPYITLFAEYRWLYVAGSNYVFGSTVYPAHPATSPWQVSMDAQQYNEGALGLQVNI